MMDSSFADGVRSIRLLVGRNGWGTGVHPTTRLCLEWLCQTIGSGDKHHHDHPVVLDYGCGSGILSIAALHLGAASVIGVDVEAEALVTAERNVQLNGYSTSTTTVGSTTTTTVTTKPHFRAYHVREMEPESGRGGLVDICVANILIGQLVRPSMVAVLVSYVKPGGLLCLSGVRPSEVPSLQQAYNAYMDWVDQAELSATETLGSVESYGFDVGRWSRVVGRRKVKMLDVEDMSELAIS
jgi:ribosomal protein L11 methylase PrmA